MLVATTTFVRPSTDVAYYTTTDEFNTAFNNQFISTGKLVGRTSSMSADGLTLTVVNKYRTKADFEDFLASEIGITMKEARLLYSVTNGISIDYFGMETVD
jgi:maltodextrin utilization protein YvdJ